MLDRGFGFERYAAWMIDEVPMYFVYRDGRYIDVAGARFRDFMAGRIPALAGEVASIGDFADHLTTVFTMSASSASWRCAARTRARRR